MVILYGLLVMMLCAAIGLLALPFRGRFSKRFFLLAFFVVLFSLSLYQFTGNQAELRLWLAKGQQHYVLQEEIAHLGGFAEIINRIKQKLAANPNDAQGWFILGKLYLANQNYADAKEALGKAHELRPQDLEIKHFYDLAVEQSQITRK